MSLENKNRRAPPHPISSATSSPRHVAENKYPRIHTRFPPEPNGYLHIGHAKSICLNFGIAHEFGGICNLRMDDTNPTKEDVEYVDSISEDVNWLIGGWADKNLGLKPKGETPETTPINGKPDFYLAPSSASVRQLERKHPRLSRVEPFYASDYFDQIYEYAVALVEKESLRLRSDAGRDRRIPPPRPRKARTATAASRKTWTCSRA